ncbi:hypothetical protein C8Q80DRAFT_1125393 [Daedaleopsis nitida]|nr:hypothetical protein C8Q80DRAFT_1125393 [Daedaleopsis nitida]
MYLPHVSPDVPRTSGARVVPPIGVQPPSNQSTVDERPRPVPQQDNPSGDHTQPAVSHGTQAQEWDGWPDGSFERTYTVAELQQNGQLSTHWACAGSGAKTGSEQAEDWHFGRKLERRCRGILSCTNTDCKVIVRPKVKLGDIAQQLARKCESATDISPVFHNKDRISHEVKKVRMKDAARNGASDFNIKTFSEFCNDYPGLIIHSVMREVVVISMQQPLMLSELVKETCNTSEPVNGVVSDAAHGFWKQRNCLLIISSAYSSTLRCWVPGVLSCANGATTEHYRHHFLALFQSIARERRNRSWDTSRDEDFVNTEGTARSPDVLRTAAEHLLKGCQQHFRSGVTRLSRIGSVVEPEKERRFRTLTEDLLSADNLEEFRLTAHDVLNEFPRLAPWLNWWLRDEHASMLFQSHRRMEPILWESVPSTTNAEEAMHFKIYNAVGKNHNFMEVGTKISYGQQERWKIIAKQHGRTKLTRQPHRIRDEPFRPSKRPQISRYHNDGRPPDTAKALVQGRMTKSKGSKGAPGSESTGPVEWSGFLDTPDSPSQHCTVSFANSPMLRTSSGLVAMLTPRGRFTGQSVASATPDPVKFGLAHTYFRGHHIQFYTRTGTMDDTPHPHYQVAARLQFRFHLQLTDDDHAGHEGKLQSWLRSIVDMKSPAKELARCWRNTEDFVNRSPTSDVVHRCSGHAAMKEVYVSLPVALMLETPTTSWDCPEKIVLYTKNTKSGRPEVVFDLVSPLALGMDNKLG